MIITAEEFRNMGFDWDDDAELDSALKRAEYVILGLTDGRATAALAAGGKAEQYVKQAAAFQTMEILEKEYSGGSGSSSESGSTEERVSIGDFSYTSSSSSSQSGSSTVTPFDTSLTIIHLLRTAGCLFSGTEAAE